MRAVSLPWAGVAVKLTRQSRITGDQLVNDQHAFLPSFVPPARTQDTWEHRDWVSMIDISSSLAPLHQPEQGEAEGEQQQGGGGRLGQPVAAELLVEQPGQGGEGLAAGTWRWRLDPRGTVSSRGPWRAPADGAAGGHSTRRQAMQAAHPRLSASRSYWRTTSCMGALRVRST